MGAEASVPLTPVKPGFSTMNIDFGFNSNIIVLHLDSRGLSAVAQAIQETWKPGIKDELSLCGNAWSLKLNGSPFVSFNSKKSEQAWRMAMQIVGKLHEIGYHILASGMLATINPHRSTLFLRKAVSSFKTHLQLLCVSFISSDKIQFTNLPPQLTNPIKDTVRTSWSLGIQHINDVEDGVLQFKLAGNPWNATNNMQSIMAKILLQAIFTTLYCYQWVYHVNMNLTCDQDCLIFRHDPDLNTSKVPEICLISFGQGDRLRLISESDDIINMIRNVLEANWNPGRIQNETEFHGSYEFKLSGNPWNSVREESARARYLMIRIFQEMLQHGWHNVAGFNLSQVSSDRVVLLFQKQEPAAYPMFCIAPHDIDKFWLINMPTELVSHFKDILKARWSSGIKSEKEIPLDFGTMYKLTLSGLPWAGGSSNYSTHARSFMCSVIEEFSQLGWHLMLCLDVTSRIVSESNGPDYPLDVYSFWFAYNPTTTIPQPSAPEYEFSAQGAQPQQYGFRMETSSSQYGTPQVPLPTFNEPPPSYSQAMGGNPTPFGGKE